MQFDPTQWNDRIWPKTEVKDPVNMTEYRARFIHESGPFRQESAQMTFLNRKDRRVGRTSALRSDSDSQPGICFDQLIPSIAPK